MKKFLKQTTAILLAVTLCMGNNGLVQSSLTDTIKEQVSNETAFTVKAATKKTSTANAKAKSKKKNAKRNKKAHLAYEKYISKAKKEINEYSTPYFAYDDINGDGIDECIVLGDYGKGKNKKKIGLCSNMMAVYTYYKGKVRELLKYGMENGTFCGYINKKQKCMYGYWNISSDECSFYKIQIKNGKAKEGATYQTEPLFNKNGSPKYDKNGLRVCKYTVNGKKVSKKQFKKREKSALSYSKITMYKVTKKNIKKLR